MDIRFLKFSLWEQKTGKKTQEKHKLRAYTHSAQSWICYNNTHTSGQQLNVFFFIHCKQLSMTSSHWQESPSWQPPLYRRHLSSDLSNLGILCCNCKGSLAYPCSSFYHWLPKSSHTFQDGIALAADSPLFLLRASGFLLSIPA